MRIAHEIMEMVENDEADALEWFYYPPSKDFHGLTILDLSLGDEIVRCIPVYEPEVLRGILENPYDGLFK